MTRPRPAVTVETIARGPQAGGLVRVAGIDEPVEVERIADGTYRVSLGNRRFEVVVAREPDIDWGWVDGHAFRWPRAEDAASGRDAGDAAGHGSEPAGGAGTIGATMPGVVTDVLARPGQAVTRGDTLVVIEAMKMELPVKAPRDGRVSAIRCAVGDRVDPDTPLVVLDAGDEVESERGRHAAD